MAAAIAVSPSRLVLLPDEILQHVLDDLVAGIVTNGKTGNPHPYYAANYRNAQMERRRNLVDLCLSCRKLNVMATPLLYRHVLLTKLNRPEYKEEEERDDGADESIFTLGLFLRTMIERPHLRAHVRHLDCWFLLTPVLDYETDPLPRTIFTGRREFQLLKGYASGAKSDIELHIFREVLLGIYDNPRTNDAAERAFGAILLLTTELRTLSFPPPPGPTWHQGDSDVLISANEDDRPWDAYNVSGCYNVVTNILEHAYVDSMLSPTTLRNLEAVRFTFVPGFLPYNSTAHHFPAETDPGLPEYPSYTYQLDACIGILQAPRLVELESDADNGIRKVEPYNSGTLGAIKLRRAFFSSSGFGQDILEDACGYWPLTALTVRRADAADYENDSYSDPGLYVPEIDVFDTSLEKVAKTLKVLDISYDNSQWLPLEQLSCLPKLVALEHLRIGLPLLNTNNGFVTRPLCHLLPSSLKTLAIDDAFASNHYGVSYTEEESLDENGGLKEGPRRYQRLLSMALRKFAGVCGKTHPNLRSVMVFGEPPIEGPRYKDAIRAMEIAGPELGQVVVDAGRVRDLFAQSGVELQEFFHGQESDYTFRAVFER